MKKGILTLFIMISILSFSFILSACGGESTNELKDDQGLQYQLMMFYDQNQSLSEGYVVIGYTGTSEYVVIPETYNGKMVYKLSFTTFKNNKNIKSIVVSEGIKQVDFESFVGCSSLESIILPSTVTDYQLCICGCSSLKELTFKRPYNIFNVHSNEACTDCNNLKQVTLPVDYWAYDMKFPQSVEEIILTEYAGVGDSSDVYVSNREFPNLKKITLTETIDTIRFVPQTLEVINGLEYVKEIKARAFKNCANIKELVIPNSVQTIGSNAFEGCTGLTEIIVPDSVTEFGEQVFMGCSNLENVVFSNNAKLSAGVLSGCDSIKNITLPYAGKYAYYLNNQLNKEYDDSVALLFGTVNHYYDDNEALENGYFKFYYLYDGGYSSLSTKDRYLPLVNADNNICITVTKGVAPGAFSGNLPIDKVIIADGVTSIGELAFRETGVREVVLPNGIEEVSSEMFKDSNGLETIVIPNNVKTIGNSAFYGCTNLNNVTLNDGLETIGQEAFRKCANLLAIDIPNSCHTVSHLAFCNTKLTTITGGDGLVNVGDYAFEYDYVEETVYGNVRYKFLQALGPVSNDVIWIRLKPSSTVVNQAFANCTNLNTVYIGKNSILGDEIFFNGNVLLRVIFEENQPTNSSTWRIMLNQNGTKYYLGNSYTINGVSNTKLGSITENVSITEDGYLYKNNEILGYVGEETELVLPNMINDSKVKYVGNNAFLARTDITKVTINNIEQITSMAFAYCTNLETVTLSGVDSITDNSFAYCTSLSDVVLGDSMRVIGVGAFMNCTSLENITIPSSVETIQGSAFYSSGLLNATFDSNNTLWYLIGGSSQTEIIDTLDLSTPNVAATMLKDENNLYYVFANKNIF